MLLALGDPVAKASHLTTLRLSKEQQTLGISMSAACRAHRIFTVEKLLLVLATLPSIALATTQPRS